MESSTEEVRNPMMDLTHAEQAAIDFHSMFPIFSKKLETMSKKELIRLVKRMVEFPLNEKPYSFKNQKDRELFFVSRKLMDANLIMAAEVLHATTEGDTNGEAEEVAQGRVIAPE